MSDVDDAAHTGVIRVPEIIWARRGCWRFVASGREVCIPTRGVGTSQYPMGRRACHSNVNNIAINL